MNRRSFCAALCASAIGARGLRGEPAAGAPAAENSSALDLMNLASRTAGGKQLWADAWFFHDWRFLFVGLRWWVAKVRGRA